MTVAVGYLAGKGGRRRCNSAVEAARTLKTSLTVVTVVPRAVDDAVDRHASTPNMPSTQSNWRRTPRRKRKECIDSIAAGLEVKLPQGRPPVGIRRAVRGRRRTRRRSARAGLGGRRQARPGGGRVDGRPAAALLAGAAGHQPARLPRLESGWLTRITCGLSGHAGVRARGGTVAALANGWTCRCGSSPSRFAAARCTRRRSACAPRTRYSKQLGGAGTRNVGAVEDRRCRR